MDQPLPLEPQSPSLEQGLETLLAWLQAARDQKLSHSLEENLAQAIILFEELNTALRQTAEEVQHLNEGQNEQWQRAQTAIHELSEVLSQTGIARLRRQLEKAVQSGEAHLQAIEAATQHFQQNTQESLHALNQLHMDASLQLTQAAQSIDLPTLAKLESEHRKVIGQFTDKAIAKIKAFTYATVAQIWLLPLALTMIITLTFGFLVEGTWPWDAYAQIKQEREMGRRYLNAWMQLSPAQQIEFEKWLDRYNP